MNSLVNTGAIEYIKNSELIRELSLHYDFHYDIMRDNASAFENLFINLMNYLNKNYEVKGMDNLDIEDLDNIGNNADPDDDNDFILDLNDLFPLISISGLPDNDMDGAPNECETACKALGMSAAGDDDNDNVIDSIDVYPFINLMGLAANDGDGAPATCD